MSVQDRPAVPEQFGALANGQRRSLLLVGAVVVVFALFAGRWGSHLGFSPLFLTDLLVVCAAVHLVATRLRFPDTPPRDLAVRRPSPIIMLVLGWSIARFILGGQFDLVALRDVVPYLYSALGIVAAVSLARSSPEQRARTGRILVVALGAHAVWVFVFMGLAPDLSESLPAVSSSLDVRLFQPRPDFDTAVVGVFAAYLLMRLITGSRRMVVSSLMLVLCWVTILLTESRAGLVGAVFASAVALVVAFRSASCTPRRRTMVLATLPMVCAVVALVIPQTTIGSRLVGTFGDAASESSAGANGTTEARDRTWAYLLDYSAAETSRAMVGVGYGPNFLTESGAGALLVGTNEDSEEQPRSPHNYWLGTLLRAGLVGLALMAVLMCRVAVRVRELSTDLVGSPLLFVAAIVPVSLVVPATLGVVLESPFGAVPFFWCSGLLLAWPGGRARFTATSDPVSRPVERRGRQ